MYSDSDASSATGSSLAAPPTMPNYPNLTARVPTKFEIAVTDPERKGEGMQQYICYKVSSALSYAEGSGEPTESQSCVIRRFSDFVWLHETLESELKGLLIPPIPDKALMGRFNTEFVEERRRALQLFLIRLMEHPIIRQHGHVLLFLTGTDAQLNAVRSRGEQGIKKTTTKSIMSFFTSSMQLVTNTLSPSKDYPKSEDDLACEKIQEYAVNLQNELTQLEAQVEAWLLKEKTLAKAWEELGAGVSMVAQAEGSGRAVSNDRASIGGGSDSGAVDYVPPPIASSSSSSSYTSFTDASLGLGGDPDLSRLLSLLGSSSDSLSLLLQRKETEESIEFREPLLDAKRTAMAVEAMLKRRQACLDEYHSALDALDSARAKLVTAQSTQGKESKLPALEQAVSHCEQVAENKKFELAQMSVAVRSEFQRSQQEKSVALSQIVRTFIRQQLDHSNKVTQLWQGVLEQVTNEPNKSSSA